MNKFTKAVIMLGLTVTMTTSVFATTYASSTQNIKNEFYEQMAKVKDIYDEKNLILASIHIDESRPYATIARIVDVYGNILGVNTKYHGNTSVKTPLLVDNYAGEVSTHYNISRPYYYKTITPFVKSTLNAPITDIVLNTIKVVNTVEGSVSTTTNYMNMWINVKSETPTKYNQDVVLKVNQDGSFKVNNLMDGTYVFTPFVGTLGIDNKWNYTAEFNPIVAKVNGNTNLTLQLEESSKTLWFLEPVDYSNLGTFLQISPKSELSPELKKVADTLYSTDTITYIENVLRWLNLENVFKASNSSSTVFDRSVTEVYSSRFLDNCGDWANVFSAMLKYKSIPTLITNATNINEDGNSHAYVEVYLEDSGKWILVNPQNLQIMMNYDTSNPTIRAYRYENGVDKELTFYTYIKYLNPEDNPTNFPTMQRICGNIVRDSNLQLYPQGEFYVVKPK